MNRPVLEMTVADGKQKIYTFPNGYGASVVQHSFSYGGREGKWELAVLLITNNEPLRYELAYNTRLTDNVLGWLSDEQVEELLNKIEQLEG